MKNSHQFRPHRTIHLSRVAGLASAGLVAAACSAPCAAQFSGFTGFTMYQTPNNAGASFSVCADVNHDGHRDVVVVSEDYGSIITMLGQPDGSFVAAATVAATGNLSDFDAADVNGDGYLDLVICGPTNGSSGVVRLYQGASDGTFTELPPVQITNFPNAITTSADFDGDGVLDLMVAGGAGKIEIRKGFGDFQFSDSPMYSGEISNFPAAAVALDIDHDNDLDLVVVNAQFSIGEINIFRNNGAGQFVEIAPIPVGKYPWMITTGDINQDGWADLVVANYDSSDMSLIVADGEGGFLPESRIASGPVAGMALGDLDGDGNPDLLTTRQSSSQTVSWVDVHMNDDGDLIEFATYTVDGLARTPYVFDSDGDYAPDAHIILRDSGVGIMRNITPMLPPLNFAMLSPPDGADGLADPGELGLWPGMEAELDWEDAAAFHHTYSVVVATDPALNGVVVEASGLTESRHIVPAGSLQPNTTYYWTVTAANPSGATQSESGVWSFTTGARVDLNGDGLVNGADLAVLLANWSTSD